MHPAVVLLTSNKSSKIQAQLHFHNHPSPNNEEVTLSHAVTSRDTGRVRDAFEGMLGEQRARDVVCKLAHDFSSTQFSEDLYVRAPQPRMRTRRQQTASEREQPNESDGDRSERETSPVEQELEWSGRYLESERFLSEDEALKALVEKIVLNGRMSHVHHIRRPCFEVQLVLIKDHEEEHVIVKDETTGSFFPAMNTRSARQ